MTGEDYDRALVAALVASDRADRGCNALRIIPDMLAYLINSRIAYGNGFADFRRGGSVVTFAV